MRGAPIAVQQKRQQEQSREPRTALKADALLQRGAPIAAQQKKQLEQSREPRTALKAGALLPRRRAILGALGWRKLWMKQGCCCQ